MRRQQGFNAKMDRTKKRKNSTGNTAKDTTADRSSGAAQENPRWTMAMDDEEDEEGRLVFHFFIDSKFKNGHIKRGKWPKIAQSMGKSIRSVQERWRKNRTSRTM